MIEEAYLKPFAGARHVHYGAAAAIELRGRIASGEVPAAIALSTYAEAAVYCANRAPVTPIQAQFSLSYAVAAALVLGDLGPAAYTPAALADPRIRRFEAMVDIRVDPGFAGRGAALTVDVPSSGRGVARVEAVPGDPGCAFPAAAVQAKFVRFAAPVIGGERARGFAGAALAGTLAPNDFFAGAAA
jgi:2-methylcitrate dehydratase PrpD